jgi:hypothetical protein
MLTNAPRFARSLLDRRRALVLMAACVLATIAVAQFLVPSTTKSATETIVVAADTFVSECTPDTAHNTSEVLKVDGGRQERSSYLRFDINSARRNVKKATLRLYSEKRTNLGVAVQIVADDSWSAADLTFNNAPAPLAYVGHSAELAKGVWVEIDVTDVLDHENSIASGGTLTLALTTSRFALAAADEENAPQAYSRFASSRTDNPPELKIETEVTPTASSSTTSSTSTSSTQPSTTTLPHPTTTAPHPTTTVAPPTGGGLRVAAVGDIQPPSSSGNSNGTAAEAAKADLILGLGDYQYQDGAMSDYNKYFDLSWGPNLSKMYPVLAPTHDQNWQAGDTLNYWNGGGAHGYKSAVPGGLKPLTPYSFDRDGWHFVALPDACFRVSCDDVAIRNWLQADLATTPSACTIAYWHQAYFTSTSSEHGQYNDMASWINVLAANHVDIVLQGHNHGYARFNLQNAGRFADPQGMQAFVVGTGGIGLYPWEDRAPNLATQQAGTFGVLNLTLRAGNYDWRFAGTSGGSYTDSGSMNCR